jgi:hypothetical protein
LDPCLHTVNDLGEGWQLALTYLQVESDLNHIVVRHQHTSGNLVAWRGFS